MAAVAARIRAVITDVTLDLDRRAPVSEAELPRLVLRQGDTPAPNLEVDPGAEHHEIELTVEGFARGASDTAARTALNVLRARVMAALNGYAAGVVFDVLATGGEGVRLYEVGESAAPAGDFMQPFTVRCVTASGNPYAD